MPSEEIQDMDDKELYEAYNEAKRTAGSTEGVSQYRLDELQLEVAQRWEAIMEEKM